MSRNLDRSAPGAGPRAFTDGERSAALSSPMSVEAPHRPTSPYPEKSPYLLAATTATRLPSPPPARRASRSKEAGAVPSSSTPIRASHPHPAPRNSPARRPHPPGLSGGRVECGRRRSPRGNSNPPKRALIHNRAQRARPDPPPAARGAPSVQCFGAERRVQWKGRQRGRFPPGDQNDTREVAVE